MVNFLGLVDPKVFLAYYKEAVSNNIANISRVRNGSADNGAGIFLTGVDGQPFSLCKGNREKVAALIAVPTKSRDVAIDKQKLKTIDAKTLCTLEQRTISKIITGNVVSAVDNAFKKACELKESRGKWDNFDKDQLRNFIEYDIFGVLGEEIMLPTPTGDVYRKYDSYKYTPVAKLAHETDQFYEQFLKRLKNIPKKGKEQDRWTRETAAWVEYRMNLTDHFLADGSGKASAVVAAFVCMMTGSELPNFKNKEEYFGDFLREGTNILDIEIRPAVNGENIDEFKDDKQFINWRKNYVSKFPVLTKTQFIRRARGNVKRSCRTVGEEIPNGNQNSPKIISLRHGEYEGKADIMPPDSVATKAATVAIFTQLIDELYDKKDIELVEDGSTMLGLILDTARRLFHNTKKGRELTSHRGSSASLSPMSSPGSSQISNSLEEMNDILRNKESTAKAKNEETGEEIELIKHRSPGINGEDLKNRLRKFAKELTARLNNKSDPIETAAFIAYTLNFTESFFKDANARTTTVIITFAMMYLNFLPPSFTSIRTLFPLDDLHTDKYPLPTKLPEDGVELKDDQQFQKFYLHYKKNFEEPTRQQLIPDKQKPEDIDSIWLVKESDAVHHNASIFDNQRGKSYGVEYPYGYVSRSFEEISNLKLATGLEARNLVVFRPTRMALHKTIAYLTTLTQLDPGDLDKAITRENGIFQKRILPRIVNDDYNLESDFDAYQAIFEKYADYIMADYVNKLSPDTQTRQFINKYDTIIVERISQGKYVPRSDESYELLLDKLLVDESLRQHFEEIIEAIVSEEVEKSIEYGEMRPLTQKGEKERIANIISGGSASGKTNIGNIVKTQIGEEALSDTCKINTDHYKKLLTEYNVQSKKNRYAMSLVHQEASYVAEEIIRRNEEMLSKKGKAPDIYLDVVTMTERRLRLAECSSATYIKIPHCPLFDKTVKKDDKVKKYIGAFNRSINRGKSEFTVVNGYKSNNVDYGRFVTPKEILGGHKRVSTMLPAVLENRNSCLGIYDSEEDLKIIASIDDFSSELKIFDPASFREFIYKCQINENAKNDKEVFPAGSFTAEKVAKLWMEYPKHGVSLSFLYSDEMVKHPGCNNYTTINPGPESGIVITDPKLFVEAIGDKECAACVIKEAIVPSKPLTPASVGKYNKPMDVKIYSNTKPILIFLKGKIEFKENGLLDEVFGDKLVTFLDEVANKTVKQQDTNGRAKASHSNFIDLATKRNMAKSPY